MKKDVYLNFSKMFGNALFLLLAAVFVYLAVHQGMQNNWVEFLLCVIAPAPFFVLMLIIRKREFSIIVDRWLPLMIEVRFYHASIWFGLFQWIFLGIHKRNKIIYKSRVAPGKKYSYSGIYSEDTKRTAYTDWREGNTYYTIRGRRLYITSVLPDRY